MCGSKTDQECNRSAFAARLIWSYLRRKAAWSSLPQQTVLYLHLLLPVHQQVLYPRVLGLAMMLQSLSSMMPQLDLSPASPLLPASHLPPCVTTTVPVGAPSHLDAHGSYCLVAFARVPISEPQLVPTLCHVKGRPHIMPRGQHCPSASHKLSCTT